MLPESKKWQQLGSQLNNRRCIETNVVAKKDIKGGVDDHTVCDLDAMLPHLPVDLIEKLVVNILLGKPGPPTADGGVVRNRIIH